jgi:hypothetical protein
MRRKQRGLKLCECSKKNLKIFLQCRKIKSRLMWGTVCFTFGIKKPIDVGHLFGPWLRSFSKKQRNLLLVGMAAFCWALWISRNDLVFYKSQFKSILQVPKSFGVMTQTVGWCTCTIWF